MRKNIMRTPEEKEKIVLEYLNTKITIPSLADKYHTVKSVICRWIKKYEKEGIDGLISQTGRKTGTGKGRPKKPQSKEEELKRRIMILETENARLKKGYLVKGGGDQKEYVTTPDRNTQ